MKRDIKVYKHGIFTRNIAKGAELINKLIEGKVILKEIKRRDYYYVECDDSTYQILSFGQNTRGYRMHYAYVDRDLLELNDAYEIINCVIKPTLTPSYYMYDDNKEYSWDNHLIYF